MLSVKTYCSVNKWYMNVLVRIHSSDSFFWVGFIKCVKDFLKKLYSPFLWIGSTASRLQSHHEEAHYFLPLSYHRSYVSQKSCRQLFLNSHIMIANSDVMFCAIWYHLYNLKNVKNTHGGVSLLVKIKAFSLQLY